MPQFVYDLKERSFWNDYVRDGLEEGGKVKTRTTIDNYTGEVGWDVLVACSSRHLLGDRRADVWKEWVSVKEVKERRSVGPAADGEAAVVKRYGLFAKARFERGDIITARRSVKN